MALALAIVSFSCTGPIVGTYWLKLLLRGCSLGCSVFIGISLTLYAFRYVPRMVEFPTKSGGWLNTVKVVLGFLELALAFKFLSNADLVLQLHLLEEKCFLAIWLQFWNTSFLLIW
jgi:thiol:disulfide interchange protein DsbD